LAIDPKSWDKKNKRIKPLATAPNSNALHISLQKLQIHVLEQYNLDYISGIAIDKNWLKKTIGNFFWKAGGEGEKQSAHRIYLSKFIDWWLKTKLTSYKTHKGQPLDSRAVLQYEVILDNILDYEKENKTTIRIQDVDHDQMLKITDWLSNDKKYSDATIKRKINRIKFFIGRAEVENIKVHKGYKDRIVVKNEEETYKHPYLNEDEINRIFKLDLSHDPVLDNIRDNFIIGLWTGLRISDFLTRLSIKNFNGNFIEIKTKKTGFPVSIPIHPMVKAVLNKRNGQLQKK
jgi:hypothetical protein